MAYDATKDKLVKKFDDVAVGEKVFVIGVYKYNGGDPKLGIQKKFTSREGKVSYGSMGRLFKEEARAILHALDKASEEDW